MNRKIKLIWDFRNEEALQIAKNHNQDIEDYATVKKLLFYDSGTSKISTYHSISFLVVDESDMIIFRDALKPHRAEVAE